MKFPLQSALWIGMLAVSGAVFAAPLDSRLADAAKNQDRIALRSLLKQKADVNGSQPDGTTALIWASHFGDAETVDQLLAAGANPNSANRYGVTALREAAVVGSAPVTEKLLGVGADPNSATSDYGETPLMSAARTGNNPTIQLLLDHGAKINAQDTWQDQTPLMRAVVEDHKETIKLLIAHGADVNLVAHTLELPRRTANIDFARERITGGFSALMFAARQGDVQIVRILLDAGAKTSVADRDGMTPLIIATMNGNFEAAAALVEKGADVKDGSLWEAVEFHNTGHSESHVDPAVTGSLDNIAYIQLLLDRGADPLAAYTKMRTQRGVRGTSLGQPPNTSPLQRAAQSADVQVMKMMLAKSGAIDGVIEKDKINNVLLAASTGGRGRGGAMLFRAPASKAEQEEAVTLSLDQGADVNAVNNQGNTPLHTAAQAGNDDLVKLLAEKGAKVEAKNKQGFTALDLAMGKGGRGGMAPPPDPHISTAVLLRQMMGLPPDPELTAKNATGEQPE